MKYELSYDHRFTVEISKAVGDSRIILASNSPRRAEILEMLGIEYEKMIPEVDEYSLKPEQPIDFALRLANLKAEIVKVNGSSVVVGADTIVVLGDRIIGKPADRDDAFQMLSALSQNEHAVITALALKASDKGRFIDGYAESKVKFKPLSPSEINAYIETGEPFGKAGAYAIQGRGGDFVKSFQGELDNIIGFPAKLFLSLLAKLKSEV